MKETIAAHWREALGAVLVALYLLDWGTPRAQDAKTAVGRLLLTLLATLNVGGWPLRMLRDALGTKTPGVLQQRSVRSGGAEKSTAAIVLVGLLCGAVLLGCAGWQTKTQVALAHSQTTLVSTLKAAAPLWSVKCNRAVDACRARGIKGPGAKCPELDKCQAEQRTFDEAGKLAIATVGEGMAAVLAADEHGARKALQRVVQSAARLYSRIAALRSAVEGLKATR